MATPMLRSLRRGFPHDRIVCLMRPVIAQVLEGLRSFDDSILWNPGGRSHEERTWQVLRTLRRARFELAVLLRNSFHSAALIWAGGAKRRVGYRRDGRGWLLTDQLDPERRGRQFVPSPVIDYYLNLAYHLGCPRESYRLDMSTSPTDEEAADRVWQVFGLDSARQVVVLNPGAAFGAAKFWPTSHFGELARRLGAMPGTHVLVLCGPGETAISREIVTRAAQPTVHSIADFPISIGLSKACVRRANLMVTTDSGPRHFAAAFDVPVISLFGPTHIRWSETFFAKAVHLQKEVSCGPCQLPRCPLDHRCMKELAPDEVFQKAVELLTQYPGQKRVA